MRVRIEKLVYGGAGLARTDQGVVFVERVLPGELVDVEPVTLKKDYIRARLVGVLEPSPDRIPPACPNFESVGCCDWAHIRGVLQEQIKKEIVVESLRRTAQLEWVQPIDTIRSLSTGYRLRAAFHISAGGIGFVREGTHEVVPIESCSALMPELNTFLGEATSAIASQHYAGAERIRAIASPTSGEVAAVFLSGRGKAPWKHRVVGTEVNGLKFRLRPEGFFQPNRYTLVPLMERVAMRAEKASLVLDLFCGDAFFSLHLARRANRVIGVDRRSITNAARNAYHSRIENVHFVRSSALRYINSARIRPDAIVLDPPRGGAGKHLIRGVGGLGAPVVIYVSCNPTTLGADCRTLHECGYALKELELVDQFPNTHHIETVAVFRKS